MVSAGDMAWLVTSAAMVLIMTPALGFFYGGVVRRKNVTADFSSDLHSQGLP